MPEMTIQTSEVVRSEKGDITKLYRGDVDQFEIREVYSSKIHPHSLKGCKLHKEMTCRLKVIQGEVTFYTFNAEKEKVTSETIRHTDAKVAVIPPNTWFAFENQTDLEAEILNLSDKLHDPNEQVNEPTDNFKW